MVFKLGGDTEVHCIEKDSKSTNVFVRVAYTNVNTQTSLLGYAEGSFSFIANNVAIINGYEVYPSGEPFHRLWNSSAVSCLYRYEANAFQYECQNSGAGSRNSYPLQQFTVPRCLDTPQKCLKTSLSNLDIAEQYCFWNPNDPSKPLKKSTNNVIYSSDSSGKKDPHTYHGTNIGRYNTLGAYRYTWPASTCSNCDLLEKGFYSTDSITAMTSDLLLMTATYNAVTGPIKGLQGPSIFGFTSTGDLVARSCDTALNSNGYYYITNCFYSKRKAVISSKKESKSNEKVVNDLLAYYPNYVFTDINEIINAGKE